MLHLIPRCLWYDLRALLVDGDMLALRRTHPSLTFLLPNHVKLPRYRNYTEEIESLLFGKQRMRFDTLEISQGALDSVRRALLSNNGNGVIQTKHLILRGTNSFTCCLLQSLPTLRTLVIDDVLVLGCAFEEYLAQSSLETLQVDTIVACNWVCGLRPPPTLRRVLVRVRPPDIYRALVTPLHDITTITLPKRCLEVLVEYFDKDASAPERILEVDMDVSPTPHYHDPDLVRHIYINVVERATKMRRLVISTVILGSMSMESFRTRLREGHWPDLEDVDITFGRNVDPSSTLAALGSNDRFKLKRLSIRLTPSTWGRIESDELWTPVRRHASTLRHLRVSHVSTIEPLLDCLPPHLEFLEVNMACR